MGLGNVVRVGTNVLAFLEILVALPLSLDIGGEGCMLTLSVLVVLFYWAYSTIHLLTRNTSLRSLFSFLACFQPLVIAALLLFTLSLHSPHSTLLQSRQALDKVAQVWRTTLLKSSPLFYIAEAIASLICVQAVSRYSSQSIAASSFPDLLQLLWLTFASGVYVFSSYFLYGAYEATSDPSTATLLAIAVTCVVFLSGISFGIRKGNIVETSGVFAFVIFQIYHLNGGAGGTAGIYQFIQTKNGQPPLPPVVLRSFDALVSQCGVAIDFVRAASSALPLPVLVGLFYRVIVLYSATTVILALKRQKEGYLPKRKLSEEDSASKFVTIISIYSRLMLISVYTHLLLLNNSENPHFWTWVSIFLTIGLWGVELRIGGTDDARWKTD